MGDPFLAFGDCQEEPHLEQSAFAMDQGNWNVQHPDREGLGHCCWKFDLDPNSRLGPPGMDVILPHIGSSARKAMGWLCLQQGGYKLFQCSGLQSEEALVSSGPWKIEISILVPKKGRSTGCPLWVWSFSWRATPICLRNRWGLCPPVCYFWTACMMGVGMFCWDTLLKDIN